MQWRNCREWNTQIKAKNWSYQWQPSDVVGKGRCLVIDHINRSQIFICSQRTTKSLVTLLSCRISPTACRGLLFFSDSTHKVSTPSTPPIFLLSMFIVAAGNWKERWTDSALFKLVSGKGTNIYMHVIENAKMRYTIENANVPVFSTGCVIWQWGSNFDILSQWY